MATDQGLGIELNTLAGLLNDVRNRTHQILSQRFGINYPNEPDLSRLQDQPPTREHLESEGRLDSLAQYLTDRNQRRLMIAEFQQLQQMVNPLVVNVKHVYGTLFHRYKPRIRKTGIEKLWTRWVRMEKGVEHLLRDADRLYHAARETLTGHDPKDKIVKIISFLHDLAISVDIVNDKRRSTEALLDRFVANNELKLVKQTWLPSTGHQPTDYLETLTRLEAAVIQCPAIVNRHQHAQPVRQFAQGLLLILPGTPAFDGLFAYYNQQGYLQAITRLSPAELTQLQQITSQRIVRVRNRLNIIRMAVRTIAGSSQNEQADQRAIQRLRDVVLPALNEVKVDVDKLLLLQRAETEQTMEQARAQEQGEQKQDEY